MFCIDILIAGYKKGTTIYIPPYFNIVIQLHLALPLISCAWIAKSLCVELISTSGMVRDQDSNLCLWDYKAQTLTTTPSCFIYIHMVKLLSKVLLCIIHYVYLHMYICKLHHKTYVNLLYIRAFSVCKNVSHAAFLSEHLICEPVW